MSEVVTRIAHALLLAVLWASPLAAEEAGGRAPGGAFEQGVDLSAFRLIAVQHQGRFKTLDTLARTMIQHITGGVYFEQEDPATGGEVKHDPVFLYLDIVFRPEAYADVRLVYVRNKSLRGALARAAGGGVDAAARRAIVDDGLVSLRFLTQREVWGELQRMRTDLVRTAKHAEAVLDAAGWLEGGALASLPRVIPPPGSESAGERWYEIDRLGEGEVPDDAVHAGLRGGGGIPGMEPGAQAALAGRWAAAKRAWREGDAKAATRELGALAAALPEIAPRVYPSHRKLVLEHWYYRSHKMTWAWWFYMVAVVLLLMGVVYGWGRARRVGGAVFVVAFGLHTVATGIRWYLAGRIPNANMFEAVTAAGWLGAGLAMSLEAGTWLCRRRAAWWLAWLAVWGGVAGFVLSMTVGGAGLEGWREWGVWPTGSLIVLAVGAVGLVALAVGRRSGAGQGLALLSAAVVAMVGLMCGRYMTVSLPSDITPAMPILNALWLYIHVNMIIASYALIGMAAVTAGMYVVGRLLTRPSEGLWLSMLIPAAVAPLPALWPTVSVSEVLPAWSPFLAVMAFALMCHAIRMIGGRAVGARSYAVWQGLPLVAVGGGASGGGSPVPITVCEDEHGGSEGLAQVLDGITMMLLELSFITLWVGIIMGAIWADRSWGRCWGWDPKEVFALNTWIIFLILVHVRLKVRDKALWTAVLAVVGCSVMLFNWIVVNYFIRGLHSYA